MLFFLPLGSLPGSLPGSHPISRPDDMERAVAAQHPCSMQSDGNQFDARRTVSRWHQALIVAGS
jgi:hypothetical protein